MQRRGRSTVAGDIEAYVFSSERTRPCTCCCRRQCTRRVWPAVLLAGAATLLLVQQRSLAGGAPTRLLLESTTNFTAAQAPAHVQHLADERCPAGNRSGIFVVKDGRGTEHRTTPDQFFERVLKTDWVQPMQPRVLSRDPWVMVLDSFLSAKECQDVLDACEEFRPDITATGRNDFSMRNSSSFNCKHGMPCWRKEGIRRYLNRLSSVTGVAQLHFEGLSVLRYLPGGYYRTHHDTLNRPTVGARCYDSTGPRVLTFMTYLTDVAEEDGGATRFVSLGLDVQPKAGRLLLWQDTKPQSPLWPDHRTDHEALPVLGGVKVTATSWITQYDRVASVRSGCCSR